MRPIFPLLVVLPTFLLPTRLAAADPTARLPGWVPPLFDRYVAEAGQGEGGVFAYRAAQGSDERLGAVVGSTKLALLHAGAFDVAGGPGSRLRIFGSHGVAFSLTYVSVASVRLGPVEPNVTVGFSGLTLDVVRGHPSAELFSPLVGAGLGVRLTHRLVVGAEATSEYLWRWFGTDYRTLSGTLFVRVEGTRYYGEL